MAPAIVNHRVTPGAGFYWLLHSRVLEQRLRRSKGALYTMWITDHIRSANAGWCLGSLGAFVVGLAGLMCGLPFGMTALVAGIGGGLVTCAVSLAAGRLNPENKFRKLSFAAGLGAAAFCMYSLAGPGPDAQHNRNRVFAETKALVARFERAVNGTPQPKYNHAPVRPAPVQPDKNTGWIGVAPGSSSKR